VNVPLESGHSLATWVRMFHKRVVTLTRILSHMIEASDKYDIFSPQEKNGEALRRGANIKVMVFPNHVF
jgi:hypothetical protein